MLKKWVWLEERPVWHWLELRNLCCGLEMNDEPWRLKGVNETQHQLLFHADEAICRAIFAGQLKPWQVEMQSINNVRDLLHSDSIQNVVLNDYALSEREEITLELFHAESLVKQLTVCKAEYRGINMQIHFALTQSPEVMIHKANIEDIWRINLLFDSHVAVQWASTRFAEFPFRQEDCPKLSTEEIQKRIAICKPTAYHFSDRDELKQVKLEEQGTSRILMLEQDLESDWESYKKYKHVPLKEAVLLSIGIAPDWDKLYHQMMTGPRWIDTDIYHIHTVLSQRIQNLLSNRLPIALNHADEFNWKYDDVPRGQFTELHHVRLHAFCDWLIQHDFEVHERFRAIWSKEGVLLKRPIDEISELLTSASRWKKRAKEIGEQYLQDYGIQGNTSDNSRDLTLEEISKQIAKQLKQEGFLSNRKKPISSDTVLRDALSGTWYQEMVDKGLTRQR